MAKTYNVTNKKEARKFIVKLIERITKENSAANKININIRCDNNAKTVKKKKRQSGKR